MGFYVIRPDIAHEYPVVLQILLDVINVLRFDVERNQHWFSVLLGCALLSVGRLVNACGILRQLVQVGVQVGVRRRFLGNRRQVHLFLHIVDLQGYPVNNGFRRNWHNCHVVRFSRMLK